MSPALQVNQDQLLSSMWELKLPKPSGKVGKLLKPRLEVDRSRKKPVTVALQEERPGPFTNDSESKAGT